MKVREVPKRRNTQLHNTLASKRSSNAAGRHASIKDAIKTRRYLNLKIRKGEYE